MTSPRTGLRAILAGVVVAAAYWGYEHVFWTTYDPTLDPVEQAQFDAFGTYYLSKAVHRFGLHVEEVTQHLWGTLVFSLYAWGFDVFGERLSSIRKVIAVATGVWGVVLYWVVVSERKRPWAAMGFILFLIPFSAHIKYLNRGYASFYTFLLNAASMMCLQMYAARGRPKWLWATGLVLGLSFAFKYELALLGLACAMASLYVMESEEASERAALLGPDPASGIAWGRYLKLSLMGFAVLASILLVRMGMFAHLFTVFWCAVGVLATFEIRLIRKGVGEWFSPLWTRGACVLASLLGCIGIEYFHLRMKVGAEAAADYFMRLLGTGEQIGRMSLSSPTFSDLSYFWSVHPVAGRQVALWAIVAAGLAVACCRFRAVVNRFPLGSGLLAGVVIYGAFEAFGMVHVPIYSLYYWFTAVSVIALAVWHSTCRGLALSERRILGVYLAYLVVGSLGLLRESGSLDHNLWPMLPPLLGVLMFLGRSFDQPWMAAFRTLGFATVVYFAAAGWGGYEREVLRGEGLEAQYVRCDDELDLRISPRIGGDLRAMREYLATGLGPNEHIFIFSSHLYPYLFTVDRGLVARRLPHFQTPDPDEDERLFTVLSMKPVRYVLWSEGIEAYHSDRVAERYPRLANWIGNSFEPTEHKFLNFRIYQRSDGFLD